MDIATGFAVRLDTVEPVHHLVGLAVRAEQVGTAAVLVGDGGTGRDVFVAVAAMAVATGRIALLPLSTASSPTAVRRARPALAALDELSDGRVIGCFPAAAPPDADLVGPPSARIERDRVISASGSWTIWTPAPARPALGPTDTPPDVVAYRLERYDGDELAEIAAHARAAGLRASIDLVGTAS